MDSWNCSNGCASENQCEYSYQEPVNPVQIHHEAPFNYYNDLVPNMYNNSMIYENSNVQQVPAFNQDYNVQYSDYQLHANNQMIYQNNVQQTYVPTGEFYQELTPTYPPCQGPQPWNFAQCYGYYGEAPCQFADVIDMEDFMNNEKRKEKSRDAARCRRSREGEIFTELAAALPMKSEDIDNLDKASVMRLSISFLKVRTMVDLIPKLENLDTPMEQEIPAAAEDKDSKDFKIKMLNTFVEEEKFALQAMDGFLLVLSDDGDITYVSDNIAEHLGLAKLDLLGQPIWDYSHQCDHEELREALKGRKTSPSELLNSAKGGDCNPLLHRDMLLRLKCTLTSRGRSVNIKSASYKVIHLTGHIVFKDDGYRQLLAIGRPLAHPSNIEVPLGSSTFLTKHSLDMKFTYVDEKMETLMGYQPEHLMGKSLYDCHHGHDSESLIASFKCLISKGQSETCRYRFLARNGGYVWIVTQATIVYDKQKPQSVVCVNYVISGVENENEILSCAQFEAQQEQSKEVVKAEEKELKEIEKEEELISDKVIRKDIDIAVVEKFESVETTTTTTSKKLVLPVKESLVTSGTITAIEAKPVGNANIGIGVTAIQPITAIKVNNCEIINVRRPRSVTASIFGQHPTKVSQTSSVVCVNRGQSVTAKLFAASPTLSSLGLPVGAIPSVTAQQRPQNVTTKIFAPRTEDMNKGFLMFSEDESGLTMLKDEPDDLTHLAPTAGDACIALEETAPFFSDMFDDFIIPDNYNALLTDELNSLDSQCSKSTTISSGSSNNDPFINYRDDSNDICNSPHLLSPGLSKSPDANSIPSLCSPNGSLPEDELAFMTLNMEDDLDLNMRAPYISMSESAELPLLIAEDLMWGAQPDLKQALNMSKKSEFMNQTQQLNTFAKNNAYQQMMSKNQMESSLASLLCSTLLQQQLEQQQQQQQHQLNQSQNHQQQHQIILNHSPEVKIRILEQVGGSNDAGVNPNDVLSQEFKNSSNTIEWTMNDLLQLNNNQMSQQQQQHQQQQQEQPICNDNDVKNNNQNSANNQNTIVMPQQVQQQLLTVPKIKERQNTNKRPSLTSESNSKRIKGHDASKHNTVPSNTCSSATPQLLHQLMSPSTSASQKSRSKSRQAESRWTAGLSGKSQQQQTASNSVLMNLLVSGCDSPLTIEPPDVLMEEEASGMDSPIVINDKMLTSAVSPGINSLIGGGKMRYQSSASSTVSPSLLSSGDMEIFKAIQRGVSNKKIQNDPYTNYIDTDAITSILMDLNEQDYEMNIPVNELLKMM